MATGYPDYTLELSSTVQVANGGTGLTNVTAGNILVGNGNQPFTPGPVSAFDLGAPSFTNPLIRFMGDSSKSSSGRVYFQDVALGNQAQLSQSNKANAYGYSELVGDILLTSFNTGRLLLTSAGSTVQLILDSGGVQLPKCETYNAQTTAGQGVPVILAAPTATVSGSTSYNLTLLASPALGLYRVSGYLAQVAAGGSGNMGITVTYSDGTAAQTTTVAALVASGSAGAHTQGDVPIRVATGQDIVAVVTTNNTASMVYALALERLL